MRYKTTKDILLRFLAGELSDEEEQQLGRQLAESVELQQELDNLSQIQQVLAQAQPSADLTFADRLMQRIEQEGKAGAVIVSLLPRVAAACLLAVALLAALLYYTEGSLMPDVWVGLQDLSPEEALTLTEY